MMKIDSIYTLRQPLIHNCVANRLTLNTINILSHAKVKEVFAVSGNSVRGTLRDAGALYMLNRLGDPLISKKLFHIFFSGGMLSGANRNDTALVKEFRKTFPLISLFGAAIYVLVLTGKVSIGFSYLVCSETKEIIPQEFSEIDYNAQENSWVLYSANSSILRCDDFRGTGQVFSHYLNPDEESTGKTEIQMPIDFDYIIQGTQLWNSTAFFDCSDIEIGSYVSCIVKWSEKSILGAKSSKGFGLTDLVQYVDFGNGKEFFLKVEDTKITLSEKASNYMNIYNSFLEENTAEIIDFMKGIK